MRSPAIHGHQACKFISWGSGAIWAAALRLSSKHDRHSTGRPWVGLNGTVVTLPQVEQVTRVSAWTLNPRTARLTLHSGHRLGSFLNCLMRKNSCSPAVNTNSPPQSAQIRILSSNEGSIICIRHLFPPRADRRRDQDATDCVRNGRLFRTSKGRKHTCAGA